MQRHRERPLNESDPTAQASQHKTIPPEPSGQIQQVRVDICFYAHCLGYLLPFAATETVAVPHRAGYKFRSHWTGRLSASFLYRQALLVIQQHEVEILQSLWVHIARQRALQTLSSVCRPYFAAHIVAYHRKPGGFGGHGHQAPGLDKGPPTGGGRGKTKLFALSHHRCG